jgi:5-methylcytosine-specific restriction endonuclease McrA
MVCRGCGADGARYGYCRPCRDRRPEALDTKRCTACGDVTTRRAFSVSMRLCEPCAQQHALEARRARDRKRHVMRRLAKQRRIAKLVGDVTPTYERQLRADATHCPLCTVRLVNTPLLDDSKELDHIVPLCIGGTHTVGNVRIICRRCNITRPRDGSDLDGVQLTLWAIEHGPIVKALHQWARIKAPYISAKPKNKVACKCGREIKSNSARCKTCNRFPGWYERAQQALAMCLEGVGWQEIADTLGYAGSGAAYNAVRVITKGSVPPKSTNLGRTRTR